MKLKPVGEQVVSLMDAIMGPAGYRWQRGEDPKPQDAPDHLFEPLEDDGRIEGDHDKWSVSSSLSTWLDTHPAAKACPLVATVLGAAAALRARTQARDRGEPGPREPGGPRPKAKCE